MSGGSEISWRIDLKKVPVSCNGLGWFPPGCLSLLSGLPQPQPSRRERGGGQDMWSGVRIKRRWKNQLCRLINLELVWIIGCRPGEFQPNLRGQLLNQAVSALNRLLTGQQFILAQRQEPDNGQDANRQQEQCGLPPECRPPLVPKFGHELGCASTSSAWSSSPVRHRGGLLAGPRAIQLFIAT